MALGATIDEVIRDGRRDVEFAIFGTRDPDAIAAVIDDLCASVLGARVRMYHFYRSSIASVHGVELTDGRSVVVKAHQPRVPRHRIAAIGVVQRSLARDGFPCPRLLAGPIPLGNGTATIEEERVGRWHDGHDPRFRRAMAVTLAELVDRCRGMDVPGIPLDHLLALPTDQLWPRPHSTEFDFDATREGAEAIDAAATAARAVLEATGAPATVVAHTDWRAENMRFDGNRISVVYDWESVKRTSEAMLVGGAGFSFPADWHRPPRGTQAPSLEEVRAFVAEYEEARGSPIERPDRRLIGATYLFGTAYVARCCHARDPRGDKERSDGFRSVIDRFGVSLLDAFD